MHQHDVQDTNPAQAALFDRYGEVIFAYLRSHACSREDAEDLTLEVFIAALRQEESLTQGNEAGQLAWLKRVARNKLVDYYCRIQRHPTAVLNHFFSAIHRSNVVAPQQPTFSLGIPLSPGPELYLTDTQTAWLSTLVSIPSQMVDGRRLPRRKLPPGSISSAVNLLRVRLAWR